MAAAPTLPNDQTLIEQTFARGIVRDSNQIPTGGLYDAIDYFVEEPGLIYKRGGWARQATALGGTSCLWVGAINVSNKIVAIDSTFHIWDVTGATTGSIALGVGFAPREHSTQYLDKILLCDEGGSVPFMLSCPGGTWTLAALGGSPPHAAHSTVYSGRIVLGHGPGTVAEPRNRLWFSELPDVEATWDTTFKWIDTSYDITGLSTVGGVLLIFSAQHVERILGGVPPGEEGSDMQLQPLAGVGCLDARSIVTWDETVIFAGEEGVWYTNGAGIQSLTEKTDGTGIQVFWRRLFPRGQIRQIIGGLFNRDFYIVCILDSANHVIETLVCHLPSVAWTRVTNVNSNMMAQGRTGLDVLELYSADSTAPWANRLTDMLRPMSTNINDGNGVPVQPTFTTRQLDGGTPSLKAYGFGRLSYNLRAAAGTASLKVTKVVEIGQETNTDVATLTVCVSDDKVSRGRFRLFGDYQCLAIKVAQQGPSAMTNVYFVEAEARPYPPAADFNTS